MQTNKQHTAWRFVNDNTIRYVQTINYTGHGDRYSYTNDESKAVAMSEKQCRDFCAYMKACDTVGFWS